HREAAAIFLGAAARRFGRGRRTRRTGAGTPWRARTLVLLDLRNDVAQVDRRGAELQAGGGGGFRLFLVVAESLLGFLLGLALGFLVVTAAIVLVALARLGGLALGALDRVARVAAERLRLGDATLLGLANLGA